jgi:hypothetical protein
MSGRLGLLAGRLTRLADCVLVRCPVENEIPETPVAPRPAMGLGKISPGHRFAARDDAGFQWPAAHLTTVAPEQPGVAKLRPLPILLPEKVPRQITKTKVIWHQTRVTARRRVTLAGLKLGDQFSKRTLINDWREHEWAGQPASHANRQRRPHSRSLSQGDVHRHARSSRQTSAVDGGGSGSPEWGTALSSSAVANCHHSMWPPAQFIMRTAPH